MVEASAQFAPLTHKLLPQPQTARYNILISMILILTLEVLIWELADIQLLRSSSIEAVIHPFHVF